ncbi:unnamed protein product, partial [marine sediment metagenome]
MDIKLDPTVIKTKSIEIALEFLRNTMKKHCNMELNISETGSPDLIIKIRPYIQKDSISEPSGYRFTPSKGNTPALLEGESSSGITGGLIYLGEHIAVNGSYPDYIQREPVFDLRLAS